MILILAELRRPIGRQAQPHTQRKEQETHEYIFSWLSWLAHTRTRPRAIRSWARAHDNDSDDNGAAQHGGQIPSNRLAETCSLSFTAHFLTLGIHVIVN